MEILNNEMKGTERVTIKRGIHKKSEFGFVLLIISLFLLLFISIIFSVCKGIAGGDFKTFIKAVGHSGEVSNIGAIMRDMRMPRALAACLTGMAFALSGALMQGITRNSLSDSGLLGINAGAGFFVSLSMALFPAIGSIVTFVAAFGGAAFAVLLVYGFGAGGHKTESFQLILAGAAVSALLTALSQAVSLAFGTAKALSFWVAGSLAGITWGSLKMFAPFIILAGILGMFLSRSLSILALGEDSAIGLGINVRFVRLVGILIVLMLAGGSVSLVGGISFLGLIIPHISRLLVGTNYRRVLPVSALLGGTVLVLSDVVARTINAPFDTPVGAIVSMIGVPVFFALTYKKEGGFL